VPNHSRVDPLPPHIVIPVLNEYYGRATTHGLEISSTWKATNRWKLVGNYSFFKASFTTPANNPNEERQYPKHNVQVRSSHDLTNNLSFDFFASLVSRHITSGGLVPNHSRVDLRLGWKLSQDFDLSVGIQNLTSRQHRESQSFINVLREVLRSFYVQGAWKF
jgi:iron complex outermembrane receptor protein